MDAWIPRGALRRLLALTMAVTVIALFCGCQSGGGGGGGGGNDDCVAAGGACQTDADCCANLACSEAGACEPAGGEGEGEGEPGVVTGQVSGVDGTPIAGVAVEIDYGRSASTDDNGFFSFANLPVGQNTIAQFRKEGFAATARQFTAAATGTQTPGCVIMARAAETVLIDAAASSTQRSGDSAVTIEAGTLVDEAGNPVTGEVALTATFIDPSTDGVLAFPGDFANAEAEGGETVQLESFGFAIYELTQDGEPVNLAPGETAEIEYVLPDNAQTRFAVGDTIPLWEFDETTATWLERGTGEVGEASDGSGRLAWYADVTHFSAWNCDAPLADKHCLTGRVLVDGDPVVGAEVTAVGVSYSGTNGDRTNAAGEFCVDVMRGSTVRVEVRLNGSATPVATREVEVPDTSASCDTGGCTDLDDFEVEFESCVMGRVLTEDGAPAAGSTVYIVPGEAVVTDAEGRFCGRAPGGMEVYVFADGRPSVAVTTPESASCGAGDCAVADLTLTLPESGDVVGQLNATKFVAYTGFGGTPGLDSMSETYNLSGAFFVASADVGESFTMPGITVETEDLGECQVTTATLDLSVLSTTVTAALVGIGALDPGEPGRASNATATVDLLRGDPNDTDPPSPYLAGSYDTAEDSEQLMAMGFDSNQTVSFSFPGGVDIGAFDAAIEVPPDLEVTSPDLSDTELSLDTGSALTVQWVAGDPSDTVGVTLSASEFSGDPATGTTTSVYIWCEFADTGSGTVSAELMDRLPDSSLSTSLGAYRVRQEEVDVPLLRVDGTGIVHLFGESGVTRVFSGTAPPDMGDLPPGLSDPCALAGVICEEDEVCNTDTFPFTCVPADAG